MSLDAPDSDSPTSFSGTSSIEEEEKKGYDRKDLQKMKVLSLNERVMG